MNVHIDAYLSRSTGDAKREVRTLGPDSAERSHDFEVTGKNSVVLRDNAPGELADVMRLGSVKGGWPDDLRNLAHGHFSESLRVRRHLEQSERGRK
jgi:hypothetical protein